jgi:hypothetical protein
MSAVEEITINKQLVASVSELIDFYSKKGVFKVSEYKDIAEIDERLKTVLTALEAGSPFVELTAQEYGFIILIFKEGSQRIPTAIDSFGQLYSIYKSYQTLLEQKVKKDKEVADAEVPSIEELNNQ